MANPTPKGATEISSQCYLFKSATNSNDCLISAHGGYVSENRSFKVPAGLNLIFYGPHGAALQDPEIYEFAKKSSKAIPLEIFRGGEKCRNYLLTKYQGAHAGASGTEVVESYEQVERAVSNRDFQRTDKFKRLLSASPDAQRAVYEELSNDWGGSVLTIRNRWNVFFGVPLQDALKAAKKAMPSLRNFHCIFCRSYMLGEDALPSQPVQYR
jgi:hypothetical protein